MPCDSLTMLMLATGSSSALHEVTSPSAGDSPMVRRKDLRPVSDVAADSVLLMLLVLVLHAWILTPCLIVSACRHRVLYVKGATESLIWSI